MSREGKTWGAWLTNLYVVRNDEYGTRPELGSPAPSAALALLSKVSGAERDSQWLSLLAQVNGMTETWPGEGGRRRQITHLILSAEESYGETLSAGWASYPALQDAVPAVAIGMDGIQFVLQPRVSGEHVFAWFPSEEELKPLGENLEDVLQRWICGTLQV